VDVPTGIILVEFFSICQGIVLVGEQIESAFVGWRFPAAIADELACLCNLLIPHCQDCQECHQCRDALPANKSGQRHIAMNAPQNDVNGIACESL
jgi:hypothetical protein